jgi:hypothetical protein
VATFIVETYLSAHAADEPDRTIARTIAAVGEMEASGQRQSSPDAPFVRFIARANPAHRTVNNRSPRSGAPVMVALVTLIVATVALLALDLGSIGTGVDSRPGIGDDRRR